MTVGAWDGSWRAAGRQRLAAIVALALAGLLAGSAAAAVSGDQTPPGDGEVRVTRDTFTNDTITTLTLILQGPAAKPLPISMVITAVRRVRAKPADPLEMRLDFFTPRYAGLLDPKPPPVVFVLDPGTKAEESIPLIGEIFPIVGQVGGQIGGVSLPFDAAALARLGKATTIHGRLLGVAFEFTAKQMTAIRGFPSRLAAGR